MMLLGLALALVTYKLSARHQTFFAVALIGATAIEVVRPGRIPVPDRYTVGALLAAIVLTVAGVALAQIPWSARRKGVLAGGAVLVAVVVVGPPISRRQLSHHADGPTPATTAVYRWATSLPGSRIGYYALDAHYPMYGVGWANELVDVGVTDPHGSRAAADCAEYVRALADGRFDYVVLGPSSLFDDDPDLVGWTSRQAGAVEVLQWPPYTLFRVTGPYTRHVVTRPDWQLDRRSGVRRIRSFCI